MRKYLDTIIKGDQCAQYVDNIRLATNSVTQHIRNIRAVFRCIRKAGLKFTIEKCHFGVIDVEFLGRIITTQEVAPKTKKPKNSWQTSDFQSKKKTS